MATKSKFNAPKEKSIEKIIISPKNQKGTAVLYGSYTFRDGRMLTLINNGRAVTSAPLQPGQVQFNIRMEAGRSFELVYDKNDPVQSEVANFFMNHPFCEVDGGENPNFQRDLFLVQFHYQIINEDFSDLMSRLDIANKVVAMTEQERIDLCFAMGGDPRNTSAKELILELIGDTLEGLATNNIKSFNRYYETNVTDRNIITNARKSLTYGLITNKAGAYEVNGRVVGSSMQDIYNLFASDSELYENYIVNKITQLEAKEVKISDVNSEDIPASLK